jgi:2-succinyl-5-enolpyruvyl-6-hydroxy-3-cyclohexene-1-carboxylate synthase
VTDACLAPGSRSAPLALALAEHPRITVHVHLDERSAAFFALGAAKRSGRPVAVVCTSGTAAANFHPAILEADQARTPLLVLTADRPPELRGTGANQATDQLKLYGPAVRWFCEVGVPGDDPGAGRYWRSLASRAVAEATGSPAGAVHLNLAFAEPLVPPGAPSGEEADPVAGAWPRLGGDPAPGRPEGAPWTKTPPGIRTADPRDVAALAEAVRANPRGLLVAGWGVELDPGVVDGFAGTSGWPVLADPLSGARRGPAAVAAYDGLVRAPGFAAAHRPDLVVRVGAAPTSKALTAWLDQSVPQVLVDPGGGWLDPGRAASLRLTAEPSALLAAVTARLTAAGSGRGSAPAPRPALGAGGPPSPWLREWLAADRLAREAIDGLLDEWAEPFEGRVARDLVAWMPDGGTLVVGSSMPVRDVDAFAAPRAGLRFVANRGLSGIDGFVATALGVAAAGTEPVAALCGDLTLLHDATSLLGAAGRPRGAVLVVCDNDGGGIFSFLPQARLPGDLFEPLFGTPHGLDLTALAAAARVPATVVEKAADLVPALDAALAGGGTRLVVVRSERAANLARHRAVTEAVAAAVGG